MNPFENIRAAAKAKSGAPHLEKPAPAPAPSTKPDRYLRLPAVQDRIPFSRSQIHRKVEDGTFPAPEKLGKRAIAWKESVIDKWISER